MLYWAEGARSRNQLAFQRPIADVPFWLRPASVGSTCEHTFVAKRELHAEARRLRRAGWSLRRIARRLDVSLSSASVWTRGVAPPGAPEPPQTAPGPRAPESLRWCSRCSRHRPESSFNRFGSGRQWWCRDCFKAYYAERRAHHRRRNNALKTQRVREAQNLVLRFCAGILCRLRARPIPSSSSSIISARSARTSRRSSAVASSKRSRGGDGAVRLVVRTATGGARPSAGLVADRPTPGWCVEVEAQARNFRSPGCPDRIGCVDSVSMCASSSSTSRREDRQRHAAGSSGGRAGSAQCGDPALRGALRELSPPAHGARGGSVPSASRIPPARVELALRG